MSYATPPLCLLNRVSRAGKGKKNNKSSVTQGRWSQLKKHFWDEARSRRQRRASAASVQENYCSLLDHTNVFMDEVDGNETFKFTFAIE
jgi:hypothetical protein